MKYYPKFSENSPVSNTGAVRAQFNTPTPLSIDWLSVSCIPKSGQKRFTHFERANYSTSVFNIIEFGFIDKIKYLTIARSPKSPLIPVDTCIIKFENWLLYNEGFLNECESILEDFGYQYKSMNRIDICIDIQNFANNLKPHNLIKGYFERKYHLVGNSKIKTILTNRVDLQYSYFRTGTNNSFISIYLYNKSLEFREVAVKQHIIELWKYCNMNFDKDVWRLEISIKTGNLSIMDPYTGELLEINLTSIKEVGYLKHIFFTVLSKKFTFKIVGKGTKVSRWPKLVLFKNTKDIHHVPIQVNKTTDVTKAHKSAVIKLINYYDEIRNQNITESDKTRDLILTYCKHHNLSEWLIHKTNYMNIINERDMLHE